MQLSRAADAAAAARRRATRTSFPGGFLKQATPGASYTYPYVMATYVFLADR